MPGSTIPKWNIACSKWGGAISAICSFQKTIANRFKTTLADGWHNGHSIGDPLLSSVKIGPGDPARSHMANEFVYVNEVSEGVSRYIKLLKSMMYCVLHNPEADFLTK
ncbi:hypothetical protein A0256_22560 [Mucilaginibacter sp. PAMC 26640]|nr:hypothetical protein A0256_22560 [Mucilaginibacter sp. PAMC 26640]